MKILAIDSCSNVATGAVVSDGVVVSEFVINNKKTHSVKLLPAIENMLADADLTYNDIDLFACTTGPGSFTGQRIGVATIKGLAHAVNKPVVGVSSLKSLAYNVKYFDGLICPIMDARRQQVYTATFDNGLNTINEDRAMALCDLLEELRGKKVIFLGDGVASFKDIITDTLGDNAFFAPPNLVNLRGSSVALCAMDTKNHQKYDQLLPSYLRMSQAERELQNKNNKE
ncbi:MAG: tRNA (adenosine(37)-N6)-threonylcarbamoyltransferase complex dimerization subunit type 1 TsaB [Clostridia bacterium]|nr:tRNA (adenosine(37)-N6)-threonylcarbamoyltransferase complex dimerization subunit type 1 TsaB [Clostridia bacterium]